MKNVASALLKAQKEMGGAKKGASNPYFKSKYADLGSVLEACKDLLNENGILITQPHINRDGRNFVLTVLTHAESGEFLTSETEVVCSKANDPQALGSAISYARRYGLQSFLSMPAEDDDGENAMARKPAAQAPAKAAPATVAPKAVVAPVAAAPAPVVDKSKSTFRKSPVTPTEQLAEAQVDNGGW